MSFNWKEFHFFSCAVLQLDFQDNNVSQEAICRIAISRAYYAAYHVAKWGSLALKIDGGYNLTAHDALIKNYKEVKIGDNDFKSRCHKIAGKLEGLRDIRNVVDYEENCAFPLNTKNAEIECKRAKYLMDEIEKLVGRKAFT